MADSIYKWSLTAANNDAADSAINWRENQLPDTVNDSNRAMMMRIAEWREDMTGGLVTTGTQPAYLATTKATFDSLTDGRWFTVRVHATNTGPATLNVNGLGSKSLRKFGINGDLPLAAGDLQLGGVYQFMYSSTAAAGAGGWVVSNPSTGPSGLAFPAGTVMLFVQAAAPAGWTKKTDNDNKALRVVSGTTGGTAVAGANFTDVFKAQTPTGTVGDTTLTAAQMPVHSHTQQGAFNTGYISVDHAHNQQGGFNSGDRNTGHVHSYLHPAGGSYGNDNSGNGLSTQNTGGENVGHFHATYISGGTSGVTANHYHGLSLSGLTTDAGSGQPHTHTLTAAAMDFAVAYVDVIVCTKD